MTGDSPQPKLDPSGRDIGILTHTDRDEVTNSPITPLETVGEIEPHIAAIATLEIARLSGAFVRRIMHKRGGAPLVFRTRRTVVREQGPADTDLGEDFHGVTYPSLEQSRPQYNFESPKLEIPDIDTRPPDESPRTTPVGSPDPETEWTSNTASYVGSGQQPTRRGGESDPDPRKRPDETTDTQVGTGAEGTGDGQFRVVSRGDEKSTRRINSPGRHGNGHAPAERTDVTIQTAQKRRERTTKGATGTRTVPLDSNSRGADYELSRSLQASRRPADKQTTSVNPGTSTSLQTGQPDTRMPIRATDETGGEVIPRSTSGRDPDGDRTDAQSQLESNPTSGHRTGASVRVSETTVVSPTVGSRSQSPMSREQWGSGSSVRVTPSSVPGSDTDGVTGGATRTDQRKVTQESTQLRHDTSERDPGGSSTERTTRSPSTGPGTVESDSISFQSSRDASVSTGLDVQSQQQAAGTDWDFANTGSGSSITTTRTAGAETGSSDWVTRPSTPNPTSSTATRSAPQHSEESLGALAKTSRRANGARTHTATLQGRSTETASFWPVGPRFDVPTGTVPSTDWTDSGTDSRVAPSTTSAIESTLSTGAVERQQSERARRGFSQAVTSRRPRTGDTRGPSARLEHLTVHRLSTQSANVATGSNRRDGRSPSERTFQSIRSTRDPEAELRSREGPEESERTVDDVTGRTDTVVDSAPAKADPSVTATRSTVERPTPGTDSLPRGILGAESSVRAETVTKPRRIVSHATTSRGHGVRFSHSSRRHSRAVTLPGAKHTESRSGWEIQSFERHRLGESNTTPSRQQPDDTGSEPFDRSGPRTASTTGRLRSATTPEESDSGIAPSSFITTPVDQLNPIHEFSRERDQMKNAGIAPSRSRSGIRTPGESQDPGSASWTARTMFVETSSRSPHSTGGKSIDSGPEDSAISVDDGISSPVRSDPSRRGEVTEDSDQRRPGRQSVARTLTPNAPVTGAPRTVRRRIERPVDPAEQQPTATERRAGGTTTNDRSTEASSEKYTEKRERAKPTRSNDTVSTASIVRDERRRGVGGPAEEPSSVNRLGTDRHIGESATFRRSLAGRNQPSAVGANARGRTDRRENVGGSLSNRVRLGIRTARVPDPSAGRHADRLGEPSGQTEFRETQTASKAEGDEGRERNPPQRWERSIRHPVGREKRVGIAERSRLGEEHSISAERLWFPTDMESENTPAMHDDREDPSVSLAVDSPSGDRITQTHVEASRDTALPTSTQQSTSTPPVGDSGQFRPGMIDEGGGTVTNRPSVSPVERVFARNEEMRPPVDGPSDNGASESGRTAIGSGVTPYHRSDVSNIGRVSTGISEDAPPGPKTSVIERVKYRNENTKYNFTNERQGGRGSRSERMDVAKSQTGTSLVYRQDSTDRSADDRSRSGTASSVAEGNDFLSQSGQTQQRPTHTAEASLPDQSATSTGRSPQGLGSGYQSTQGSRTEGQAHDDIEDSPFGSGPAPNEDMRSAISTTEDRKESAEERSLRRGQDRVDDLDVQLGDRSLQLNADVDRLVDVLYRKLERKRRMERKRRGF